jgi:hypothetical protein
MEVGVGRKGWCLWRSWRGAWRRGGRVGFCKVPFNFTGWCGRDGEWVWYWDVCIYLYLCGGVWLEKGSWLDISNYIYLRGSFVVYSVDIQKDLEVNDKALWSSLYLDRSCWSCKPCHSEPPYLFNSLSTPIYRTMNAVIHHDTREWRKILPMVFRKKKYNIYIQYYNECMFRLWFDGCNSSNYKVASSGQLKYRWNRVATY